MQIRAVVFDIGETLINETEHWGAWADFLDVPRLTFFAALGMVIARGQHHAAVFDFLGLDKQAVEAAREHKKNIYRQEDFYPDALPCLQELIKNNFLVGIAGNQPEQTEDFLHELGLPLALVASSARWGVEKPKPEFFGRIVEEFQKIQPATLPAQIAYVGDRLDNDVLPAFNAGMVAVFLERGPWGVLHAKTPEVTQAHLHIKNLSGLTKSLLSIV